MKKIIIIFILLLPFSNWKISFCQPPIYHFGQISEFSIQPDTLHQYFLKDINRDSIGDLLFSTTNSLYAINLVDFTNIITPITYYSGFLFNVNADGTNIILANLQNNSNDSLIGMLLRCHIGPVTEFDSLALGVIQYSGLLYLALHYIETYDFNTDGTENILLFCGGTVMEGPLIYNHEYINVFDSTGNLIAAPEYDGGCKKAVLFDQNDNQYLVILNKSYRTYHDNGGWSCSSLIFDSSLSPIDVSGALNYINSNIKSSLTDENYASSFIITNNNIVSRFFSSSYDSVYSTQLPANAVATCFNISRVQHMLVGCTNSYFELRDMNMNLEAFIWGPSISISDADAVDINRDGTDEILCRTATGFVLYSLDTTGTAVYDSPQPLPEEISLSSYPNPFNSDATIQVSGAGETPVSIGIYDINGRQVRSLLAISGRAVWDARNDHGEALSSGVYFVRAAIGPLTARTKLVLLK
jgi:hypothetical protein